MRKGVLMIFCIEIEFYFTDPEKSFGVCIPRYNQRFVHQFVSDVLKLIFMAIKFKTTDQFTQMLISEVGIIYLFFFFLQ